MNTFSLAAPPAPAGLRRSWVAFWFTPADPIGLQAVRVFAGFLFLAWLLPFAGHEDALFGLGGWVDARAYQEIARLPDGLPGSSSWSLLYLCGGNAVGLRVAYWLSIGVLALFTLGVCTRLTSVLTWLVVASFTANPAFRYGPDALLGVLAFYLMLGFVLLGQWSRRQSLLSRLFGSLLPEGTATRSTAANLSLRLIQVHLAVALCVIGLHKLQSGDWWAGVALWYPLHPPFQTTFADVRAHATTAIPYLFVLSLAQYLLLAWQIAFPLFAWRRFWRPLLLGGALVGWVSAILIWGQPLIGPVLVVGALSFLTAGEWRWVLGMTRRFLPRTTAATPPASDEEIPLAAQKAEQANCNAGGRS
jgi:hypothetical protein